MRFSVLLLVLSVFSAGQVFAQNTKAVRKSVSVEQDAKAIRSFAGCYEVEFNFFETLDLDPVSTVTSPPYRELGLELVVVDEESPTHVGLQHILITGNYAMKHWRQTWDFEAADLQIFKGNITALDPNSNYFWQVTPIDQASNKGFWRQRVGQVDDSPRFECSAPWVHINNQSYWECTADAPLPRREFSQRSDYDILVRRNRQEVMPWGWMHEQDNIKVVSSPYTQRALEKGYNTYKKVDGAKCAVAQKMWSEQQVFWKNVRSVWQDIRTEMPRLELRKKANGTIYDYLFEMGEEPTSASTGKDAIRAAITPFIAQ